MSHAGHEHNATQDLLQAALVIARSSRIRGWLRANDPMALQQLDAALGTHQNTQPATQPVYLVINDTDTSGTGYVVRFASEEAYLEWQTHLDRLTGDAEEPFGFRGEWGIAHAILTPEQALALVPGQQAGTLTIPDGRSTARRSSPRPTRSSTASSRRPFSSRPRCRTTTTSTCTTRPLMATGSSRPLLSAAVSTWWCSRLTADRVRRAS